MSTKFFPFYAFFSGMPPYNVLKWGKQTGRKANAMDYIYLDNAASAPLRKEALEAMLPWLTENSANASSLHSPGQRARKAIENARRACAEALDAKPEEIFFTSGGTESNVAALRGVFLCVGDHLFRHVDGGHRMAGQCQIDGEKARPGAHVQYPQTGPVRRVIQDQLSP